MIKNAVLGGVMALATGIGFIQADAITVRFIPNEELRINRAIWADDFHALQQELMEMDVTRKKEVVEQLLMQAVLSIKPRVVDYLLCQYPEVDINARSTDPIDKGMTILMHALKNPLDGLEDDTKNKKIEIAQRVLQSPNMDINAIDGGGRTALMHAIRFRYTPIVEQLLQYPGIDLRVKDIDGKSALDFARYEGCPPEITQLIQNCIRFNNTKSARK